MGIITHQGVFSDICMLMAFFTLEHGGVGALSEAVGGGSAPCEKLSGTRSRFVGWARDTPFSFVSFWSSLFRLGCIGGGDGRWMGRYTNNDCIGRGGVSMGWATMRMCGNAK